MHPHERLEFTDVHLYTALCAPEQSRAQVETLDQARYLFRYLSALGAKTMVIEHKYIDGDYLDDYASFYVRSFTSYERRCKRLHFFAETFDDERFVQELLRPASSWLQASYLGFVVGRPLPNAVVGRTVLRTWPDDNGRRHYPVIRSYDAHLFGTHLTVDSLAFQQQDTVLAACATVALWSAFQGTSTLFGARTPTPGQITQAATGGLLESRPLPSKGLRLDQMVRAIRELGLEPDVFEYSQELPLLSLLVAYSSLGIAPVIGIDIEGHGYHAVTVTGYSLQNAPVHTHEDVATPKAGFPLNRVGLRVDQLYVHDDGHGPFATIKVELQKVAGPDDPALTFTGTWRKPGSTEFAVMRPVFVVVPVYPKIRLSFIDAEHWVTKFAYLVAKVIANADQLEWQLTLATTHELKASIRSSDLDVADVKRVLLTQQPRFVWRARVSFDGQPQIDLLLDATGIKPVLPVLDVLFYDPALRQAMGQVLTTPGLEQTLSPEFFALLRTSTAVQPGGDIGSPSDVGDSDSCEGGAS